jgi:exonuclease III
MIVHYWNVRGLNSPLKQHEVSGLMKSKRLDVCGLLETKLSLAKVGCMHKLRLKTWQFVSNVEAAAYARIVVFWNPETVKVEMLHFSAQGIHILVTSLVQQFCFTTTFIYGFNTISARRALWADLRRWSMDSPWLLLGDFNFILSQEDKHNGELVSTYEISDFRECCSDLGIVDLNSTGSHFTWTNGTIWTKIDRVTVNTHWYTVQQMAHVHFGTPGAFSDHSPSTVQLGLRAPQGKRNFKFFNMWTPHPQFLETVSQNWSLDAYGTHMYILYKKLKQLKGGLKSLNKLHFSHISERVARAEKVLDDTQLLLQNDMDNCHLLAVEKQLRLNLVNLKSAEKMFFSQKLKCTFFKDCDKGMRFFHSLMSQRHRRRHIPAIVRSDGMLTSSAEEVGREFVSYYKELLGTSKHTIPLRAEVVQSGACINVDSHAYLLAPVLADDIKQVLFSMDDNKAPGPDGYTSAFFKKAWNIVEVDFCSAVKDFFASGELLKQLNHSTIALVPKSANANSAADYRPISCCNVTYKVISKIPARRLAHVLHDIISPSQNAFLGGRLMADNINLMQELLRSYGRKRVSPRCTIKIDFKKAFDTVQWPFLRDLLHLLGFPDRFVHLVMKCV